VSLAELLAAAARGAFPAPDGGFEVHPAPAGASAAVVSFAGHHVIAADVPEGWVEARLRGAGIAEAMRPGFLSALAAETGAEANDLDVVLAAPGLDGEPALVLGRADHPRAQRAVLHREDVRVLEDRDGVATVILGRGLAGRLEVSMEVEPGARGAGRGRAVLVEARKVAGPGEVLFAQTAPGNAASLRCLLAAGFTPIGGEMLFYPTVLP
jgi:GNAT superfamily N-acetyltransferase